MKKVLAILLSVLLMVACVPLGAVSVAAATSGTTGDCTWSLDRGHLTISGNGRMGYFSSSPPAPWGRGIISVTIEEGVTNIGTYAFYQCSALTSVELPDSVTSIGADAFAYCTALTSVDIPDSVTSIGDAAFYQCSALTSVTIPDSVTSISGSTFAYCRSLTSVELGDGITSISYNMFHGCSSLTAVEIPDSVTSIGSDAFYNCTSLQSVTIPNSVTSIGDDAFYGCSTLASVNIPDSVTSIGNSAFQGCTSLQSVTIPDSVTSIGNYAFYLCDALVAITVDANNPSYSSRDGVLFNILGTALICYPGGKTGAYTIPDSITSIGGSAFCGCDSLTSVTIGDGVTEIGAYAFYNCDNLQNVYYVGSEEDRQNIAIGDNNSPLTWATWTYNYCAHEYDGDCDADCNKCGAVRNDAHSYDGCLDASCDNCGAVRADAAHTYDYPHAPYCNRCGALREENSLPLNTDITVTIQNWDDTVDLLFIPEESGYYIFRSYGSSGYRGYILDIYGNQLAYSGGWYDNFYLECYFTAGTPYILRSGFYFSEETGSFPVRVFLNKDGFQYVLKDGKATITGYNGTLPNNLVIPDTIDGYPVTAIGEYAFQCCYRLHSVVIPEGVTTIGVCAFDACDRLSSVTLPKSLTTVNNCAFNACYWLTDVHYAGSEEDRWNISVIGYNDRFYEANWHYNYCFHEYDDACDEDCNLCGDVRVAPHTYTNACDGDCDDCGAVRNYAHVYDDCDDTDCNECGEVRKPGHVYDNGCDTICNRCGVVRYPYHSYDHACDEYCNLCGEWRVITHTYAGCHDGACDVCGAERETPAHTYDGIYDTDCNVCGEEREIGDIALDTDIPVSITYPGQNVCLPFTPTVSGTYVFTSHGDRDTYGHIYDRYWNQIAYNDDGGDGNQFRVECYLYADQTYYLVARFYSSDRVGSFPVRITRLENGFQYYINDGKVTISGYRGTTPNHLVIPDTIDGYPVTTIGYGAFENKYALETVVIPEGVTTIDDYAFKGCDSLYSVTLPKSLITVKNSAFSSCYWLTDVNYVGSETDRWNISILGYNDRLYEADWHYDYCLHEYDDACDEDCNICGDVRADAHDYLSACDRDCGICGGVRQAPHLYESACDDTCDACGMRRKAQPHAYDNGCDCYCNECGLWREVAPHIYDDACDEECNECGYLRDNYHDYDSVCDTDCNLCGYVRDVIGHTYSGVCDTVCNQCGTLREAPAHTYSDTCDIDCNICGQTRYPDHSYTDDEDDECDICGAVREVGNPPAFVVEDATANSGGTFTVAIRTQRNPGLVSFKLNVYYDTDVMELVGYEEGDFANLSYGPDWYSPFVVNWCDAHLPNYDADGVVVYLTFRVYEWVEAADTTISLSYDSADVYNSAMESVYFATVSGEVSISPVIYGDGDGDGQINNRDLGLLQQYLNGWYVDVNTSAADVNNDGDVNNRDLGLLQRYLNGWDVTLG